MKIKYWLMTVFLAAMVLPIAALYLLYVLLNSHHEQLFLKERLEMEKQIAAIEPHLQDEELYQIHQPAYYRPLLRLLTHDSEKITLYRKDGLILYDSMRPSVTNIEFADRDQLFQHVNELKKNRRSYSIKKAMLHRGELIGFYEITIARETWVEGVKNRTLILVISLASFMGILYWIILIFLRRKLNRPLEKLSDHMTAFASGAETLPPLTASKDEIGQLITHFNQMRMQIVKTNRLLAQKQREKEYIVAALSHDLKTPLTAIQAYAEALFYNQALTEEEKRDYQRILFDKTAHMKRMLDDLSVYTSLQSASMTLETTDVDGEEFFDMLLSGYEEPCAHKKINLKTEQCVRGHYRLDPKQMIRIMDNLVFNAIRHTNENREICLAAIESHCPLPGWVFQPIAGKLDSWRDGRTIIIVQNEGPFIPVSLQAKIFEPFFQGEHARTKGSSGLGLSIAKMLIKMHGGSISLWSEAGMGTLVACAITTNNRKEES
ncbi:HAMP domain-containing sensor histidine kinase [Bacillus xiapuensis]|uniref:HAMP domain-containing sensor histidine kinase n=1 Tax=Bacillus xiapuensis TaxID=2014075 RepID=UPI000C2482EA|nr:HAMP domain-containing sensor histidine kinase [Bacillus xiapuensis]